MRLYSPLIVAMVLSSLVIAAPRRPQSIPRFGAFYKPTLGQVSVSNDHTDFFFEDQLELVELRLENFVRHLQSFVSSLGFSEKAFERETHALANELQSLKNMASALSPCSVLQDQLVFSQYFYETMVEVTENLRHYNFVGTLDQHLVYCVSELNVRLLALFNPYGYPETTYPEYVYKFARLEGLLEIWRAYFDGLDEVPTGVRMMFHIQEYRAREKIDLLGA